MSTFVLGLFVTLIVIAIIAGVVGLLMFVGPLIWRLRASDIKDRDTLLFWFTGVTLVILAVQLVVGMLGLFPWSRLQNFEYAFVPMTMTELQTFLDGEGATQLANGEWDIFLLHSDGVLFRRVRDDENESGETTVEDVTARVEEVANRARAWFERTWRKWR